MLTVIPTIDVEGVHGDKPFEQMILGQIGDKDDWGVFHLARIFNKHNVSATFFVDVYEYTLWGEEAIKELCCRLLEMGQDVQLHTHPGWRKDPRDPSWLQNYRAKNSYLGPQKDFMAKLTLKEQIDVLTHGIELLEKWTGIKPVAHRSGGYSINKDTIEALRHVGIPVDSSMYCAHHHSLETWSKNAVVKRNGILEVPITVGQYTISIRPKNHKFVFYQRLMKTDLDIYDMKEFECYIQQAIDKNMPVLNLFMHSFSLIDLSSGYNLLKPQPKDAEKLDKLLSYCSKQSNIQISSIKEYYQNENNVEEIDFTPIIPLKTPKAMKYGFKRIKRAILNRP